MNWHEFLHWCQDWEWSKKSWPQNAESLYTKYFKKLDEGTSRQTTLPANYYSYPLIIVSIRKLRLLDSTKRNIYSKLPSITSMKELFLSQPQLNLNSNQKLGLTWKWLQTITTTQTLCHQYLSCYCPNFNQTLKEGLLDQQQQ